MKNNGGLRQWDDLFEVLKEVKEAVNQESYIQQNYKEISEVKAFLDKQKLIEFILRRFTLKKYWRKFLRVEVTLDNNMNSYEENKKALVKLIIQVIRKVLFYFSSLS